MAKAVKVKECTSWCYEFEINKQRFRGTTPFALTEPKRLANDWIAEKQAEKRKEMRDHAGNLSPSEITIEYAFQRYPEELDQDRCDIDTIRADLARIQAYFKNLPSQERPIRLAQVNDDHVVKLVRWRSSHQVQRNRNAGILPTDPRISPATVNRSCTERLMQVFNRAKNVWFRHVRVPFAHEPLWKDHLLKEAQERERIVEIEEHEALRQQLDPEYDALYRFYLLSGVRLTEALLKWSAVDWRTKTISVRRKGGKITTLPMTPGLESILRSRMGHNSEWVFTYIAATTRREQNHVKGQRYPITKTGWKGHWDRRRAKAAKSVPSLLGAKNGYRLRVHDLRHSFGTHLNASTGDMRLTQKGLAHSDMRTTERYAHVFDRALYAGMVTAEENHYLPGLTEPKQGEPSNERIRGGVRRA